MGKHSLEGICYRCGACTLLVAKLRKYRDLEWCAACWQDLPTPSAIITAVRDGKYRARGRSVSSNLTPLQFANVLLESKGFCFHCDRLVGKSKLTLDHLMPLARGGAHTLTNIVAACIRCNVRKCARTAERWRQINSAREGIRP